MEVVLLLFVVVKEFDVVFFFEVDFVFSNVGLQTLQAE
ncbi:hypothetical protein PHEL85_0417 [Polaribacter sp. Hel1_85]|nr:hypothetical protein PHEL85_0417 [Polaribacter sp. Hel1_85]